MSGQRFSVRSWDSIVPLDLTYGALTELWGVPHVRRLDARAVERLPLPVDAKRVLSELGLPADVPWLGGQSDYGEHPEIHKPIEVPGRTGRWCLLADDYGRNWSVAEGSGEVVLLSLDPSSPDAFVNSSLRIFVECLYRFELWQRHTRQLSELEAGQELVRLWNVLDGIDPPAFDDANNVWAAFLADSGWQLGWPLDLPPNLGGTASWR